jgi:hypothetical protein
MAVEVFIYANLPAITEGINGLVAKRVLVNEIYIGLITENTADSITVIADSSITPKVELNAIWRLETRSKVGRIPLCIASQIAVTNWAKYPVINVAGYSYDELYTTGKLTHKPDGENLFAVREITQINNTGEEVVLRHAFPAWVEHLHVQVNANTAMMLGDQATEDLALPYKAYYGYNLDFLGVNFRSMWQWGRVAIIHKPAVELQGSSSTYTSSVDLVRGYVNTPGELETPSLVLVSNVIDKIFIAQSISTPVYRGIFTTTQFYPTLSVVEFEGVNYIKTEVSTERFVGRYDNTWVYVENDVIVGENNIYYIHDGNTFVPYSTAITNWIPILDRGYFDSELVYSAYEAVIDHTTGLMYVTLNTPITNLITDIAWYKLTLPSLSHVALLSKIQLITTAMAPTEFTKAISYVSHTSVDSIILNGSVLYKLAPSRYEELPLYTSWDQIIADSTVKALYTPSSIAIPFLDRIALVGTRVVEIISAMVVNKTFFASNISPQIKQEVGYVKTVRITKQGTTIQLKRGNKANLPTTALLGEPIVTLDTGELFIGTGTGVRKISDVIISESIPSVEDRGKIWYNPLTNSTYLYKEGLWQITGSEATMDYGVF